MPTRKGATERRLRSDVVEQPERQRSRSKSQHANREKLLDAMLAETDRHGLDDLQSARVAKAAGLTTGALYSRYENADEMLVALWQERVRTPFLNYVRDVVQYVQGHLAEDHPVTRLVEKPTPILRLGAEYLVLAQRNDTVSEEVTPALMATLDDLGLNHASDPLAGAVVVVAASAGLGTVYRSFITSHNQGWGNSLKALRHAASRAVPLTYSPAAGDIAPDPINTGNPVRDALLTSAKRVVARVGFRAATVTRIARRAGFSTSAIYQLWPDKESMLDEAIHEVLVLDYGKNSRAKAAAFNAARPDFGFTDSWYVGMMPSRKPRLDFRIECIVASRYRDSTRREMQRFLDSADSILQAMFPGIPHALIAQITSMEQVLGYGFLVLVRFSPDARRLDYYSLMTALATLGGLSGAPTPSGDVD
ncbi:MAG: TetR/AcrR family transcriptional regulator [Ilumatobacteraceae bacterium]